MAAQSNGWLILTGAEGENAEDGLTLEQISLLQGAKTKVKEVTVFGGNAAVPENVPERIKSALGL